MRKHTIDFGKFAIVATVEDHSAGALITVTREAALPGRPVERTVLLRTLTANRELADIEARQSAMAFA